MESGGHVARFTDKHWARKILEWRPGQDAYRLVGDAHQQDDPTLAGDFGQIRCMWHKSDGLIDDDDDNVILTLTTACNYHFSLPPPILISLYIVNQMLAVLPARTIRGCNCDCLTETFSVRHPRRDRGTFATPPKHFYLC